MSGFEEKDSRIMACKRCGGSYRWKAQDGIITNNPLYESLKVNLFLCPCGNVCAVDVDMGRKNISKARTGNVERQIFSDLVIEPSMTESEKEIAERPFDLETYKKHCVIIDKTVKDKPLEKTKRKAKQQ